MRTIVVVAIRPRMSSLLRHSIAALTDMPVILTVCRPLSRKHMSHTDRVRNDLACNILVVRIQTLADSQRHINDCSIRRAFRNCEFQRHNCAIERNALGCCSPRSRFHRNYIIFFGGHTSPLRIHGESGQGHQRLIVVNEHLQSSNARIVFRHYIDLHHIARMHILFRSSQAKYERIAHRRDHPAVRLDLGGALRVTEVPAADAACPVGGVARLRGSGLLGRRER